MYNANRHNNLNGATFLRKLLVDIHSFGIIQVQNTDVLFKYSIVQNKIESHKSIIFARLTPHFKCILDSHVRQRIYQVTNWKSSITKSQN